MLSFAAAIAVLVKMEQSQLLAANGSVTHTHEVLERIGEAHDLVGDAEAQQRGYLLTAAASYRQRHHELATRIDGVLDGIGRLTADNIEERVRLKALRGLLHARLQLLDEGIARRDRGGLDAARATLASGTGERLSQAADRQLQAMRATEQRLLAERTQRVQSEQRASLAVVTGLMLANLVLVTLAFLALTRRKRAEAERDRFFALSRDGLCIAGGDGFFKRVNRAFAVTLGFGEADLLARPALDFVHPDDRAATQAEGARLREGQAVVGFENRYRCRDGRYRWISWSCTPDATTGLYYAAARDVTERRQRDEQTAALNRRLGAANRALEKLSSVDELTGLLNRRALERVVRAPGDAPMAVLMIDVDWFKKYNDTYGHPAGDHCLKQIAAALRCQLRNGDDVAARYGGEEFVVLLPRTQIDGAMAVAQRMIAAVGTLGLPHRGSPLAGVTISVGVAVAAGGRDARAALAEADAALYEAKRAGRNRCRRAGPIAEVLRSCAV